MWDGNCLASLLVREQFVRVGVMLVSCSRASIMQCSAPG
jgi:hypothetical protein